MSYSDENSPQEPQGAKIPPQKENLAQRIQKIFSDLDYPLEEEILEEILQDVRKRVEQEIVQQRRKEEKERRKAREFVTRFSLNIRVQHFLLAVAVLLLIFTGLPIKFHESAWAEIYFRFLGGLSLSRWLHRLAAILLTGISLYHLFYISFHPEGKRDFRLMIPTRKDFKDFWQNIRFYLGLSSQKPKFHRFSYVEKFDYWAVYWGVVIMVVSGFLLWLHDWTLAILPKFILDIAREVHSDEAFLATVAIIMWHFYNAHLNPHNFPFNPAIFTGKISREKMREEHPLEYDEIFIETLTTASTSPTTAVATSSPSSEDSSPPPEPSEHHL